MQYNKYNCTILYNARFYDFERGFKLTFYGQVLSVYKTITE